MEMQKHLVLISGNLGAGKTTLARKIGEKLNWFVGYESVEDNPYLPAFYASMASWAFHLQIYFLGHRAEQHLQAALHEKSAILDRSIYEDAHIFAWSLKNSGYISERDYKAYRKLYDFVVGTLPTPDLLLYLHAPVTVLQRRIAVRGQDFDRNISAEYLAMIDQRYKEWLATFSLCPVLSVDSNELDFSTDDACIDQVIRKMQGLL